MAEEEARAAVEGTILLETLKDLPGRPSGELPVRPADLPKRDQVSNQEEARVVKPGSTCVLPCNSCKDGVRLIESYDRPRAHRSCREAELRT